jgi:hypothetical protein
MRNDQIRPQFKLTIFSALLAGVLLASAQPAAAWSDYGGGYGSSYGGWDVDQQEDREWAQEDAREAG